MQQFNENTRYAVWGTGAHAAQFLYSYWNVDCVDFFIDNNVRGGGKYRFFGKKVFKFGEIEKACIEKHYIILATSKKAYSEIKKQLCEEGYKEFVHFAYYQYFYKKLVVLHGNCHMDIIKRFLHSSEMFTDNYVIYPLPPIQCIEEKSIEENVLDNCDVFIHQDIQANNEFGYRLSDEYILPKLRKECEEITVPNLFGLGRGFFPQTEWNERNPALCGGKDTNSFFPFADIVIDRAVRQGKNVEEIQTLMDDDVFSAEEIQNNFWSYMQKIRKRECNWDIPIYDFIITNYKREKLFYDLGHPTNVVMKEIALGVLKRMGIEDEHIYCDREMNDIEEFVYDTVRKTLGCEWKDHEIRKGNEKRKLRSKMTKEEYVKEYLFWCYEMK